MISRVFPVAFLLSLALPAHATSSISLQATVERVSPSSVPRGAQRVAFLSVELAASCEDDVVVTALELRRTGLGSKADIDRVYAIEGTSRLTRGTTFRSNDAVFLRLLRPLTVDACDTRTLAIVADMARDAASGAQHSFELASIESNGLNVGIEDAGTSRPPANTTPGSVGTVSVTVEGPNVPVKFGKSRTLARIRLEADNDKNQEIRSITLTNRGKATDGDIKNLRIQNRKGEILTDAKATMDGDRVTLRFEPALRLDRNDEILLELKGDVTASKRRTIRFVLEEPSDLEAAPRAR